jgi:hypothetical protein
MSTDPGTGFRAPSPSDPKSGRDSPILRISRQLADQGAIDETIRRIRKLTLDLQVSIPRIKYFAGMRLL